MLLATSHYLSQFRFCSHYHALSALTGAMRPATQTVDDVMVPRHMLCEAPLCADTEWCNRIPRRHSSLVPGTTQTHTHIHAHKRTHTHARRHIRKHARTHARTHAQTHTKTHARKTHARPHKHIHAQTHAHTHTNRTSHLDTRVKRN